MVRVRIAREDEAEEICLVLRRSITELCVSDHAGQNAVLTPWLANKTPENVRKWIADDGNLSVVAIIDDQITGVGLASKLGEIFLNYVSPNFRFAGVSKAIIQHLEDQLAKLGIVEIHLTSTETAHRFYLSVGYYDAGIPKVGKSGNASYPMRKHLD